ncbi:MAG: VOC family protein [Planctomycetaceae bacterium]
MRVDPYLFFEGRCEEALQFYTQALGAKVGRLVRFKDAPEQPPEGRLAPGSENKVMHADFKIGDTNINASDGGCGGKTNFGGFSLTIAVKTPAEADKCFNALVEGGQVTMPLSKTFFSPRFGMLTDKFGVGWMVIVEG